MQREPSSSKQSNVIGRIAAVPALLLGGVLISACSRGNSATTTSVAAGPFAARASQVISDLAVGNDKTVWAMFDAQLQAQLSVPALADAWQVFEDQYGSYKSHGSAELIPVGSLDVEQLPMTMARGTEEARVTFEPNGSIAGLVLLRAGAPPPAAS